MRLLHDERRRERRPCRADARIAWLLGDAHLEVRGVGPGLQPSQRDLDRGRNRDTPDRAVHFPSRSRGESIPDSRELGQCELVVGRERARLKEDEIQVIGRGERLLAARLQLAEGFENLPLGEEDGKLKVIIPDPVDLELQDMLRFRLNPHIEPHLASPTKIRKAIEQFMSEVGQELDRTMDSIDQDMPEEDKDAVALQAGEDPYAKKKGDSPAVAGLA